MSEDKSLAVYVRFYDLDEHYHARREFSQIYPSVTLTADTLLDGQGNTIAYLDGDKWRLTDMADGHAGEGYSDVEIASLFPERRLPRRLKGDKEKPFVVFCATDGGELALPFALAKDSEEACSLADGEVAGRSSWDVLDAMDYERLIEVADSLEWEGPDYPEGAKWEPRPLDIGWAVRRLREGCKMRFNTWNPDEYIVKQGESVVTKDGLKWRPSVRELLENGWVVYMDAHGA